MRTEYYNPLSAMRVCIDRLDGSQTAGRAYCPQLMEPILFKDLGMFLLMADRALDRRGYPLAFQKKRSLLAQCTVEGAVPLYKEVKAVRQHEQMLDIHTIQGEICTFLVHVLSRRNCSWQGRIDWIDDGNFDIFNSGLVFLRRANARLAQLSLDNMKSWQYQ
ncbi:MAG: hypothetical protein ACK5L0_02060 [Candidatus Fimivivens sp.]